MKKTLVEQPERLAFTAAEAAQLLNVSVVTVRRLVSRCLLRRCGAIRHIRIPKTEIDRFLRESISGEKM